MSDYETIRQARIAESKAEGDRYRAMTVSPSTYDQPTIDGWLFATEPTTAALIESAARKVVKALPTVDFDDAAQEGTIIVAERREEFAERLERGSGLFVKGLYQDLHNKFSTGHKHRMREDSHDVAADMEMV